MKISTLWNDCKFCDTWLYRHNPVCGSVCLRVGGGDWGMVWTQRSEAVGRLLSFRFAEFSFCPFSGDPNLPDKDTAFSSILAHWLSLWPCPLKHGCYECSALPCVYVCSQNHDFECLSGSVCACLPGHIRCVEKKKIRRGRDRQGICLEKFCLLASHLEKIQRKHPSFLILFLFSLSVLTKLCSGWGKASLGPCPGPAE